MDALTTDAAPPYLAYTQRDTGADVMPNEYGHTH